MRLRTITVALLATASLATFQASGAQAQQRGGWGGHRGYYAGGYYGGGYNWGVSGRYYRPDLAIYYAPGSYYGGDLYRSYYYPPTTYFYPATSFRYSQPSVIYVNPPTTSYYYSAPRTYPAQSVPAQPTYSSQPAPVLGNYSPQPAAQPTPRPPEAAPTQPIQPAPPVPPASQTVLQTPRQPAPAKAVDLAANDNSFESVKLQVVPGTTVTWTNRGSNVHTITSGTGLWDSGDLRPGQTFSRTFTEPGTYWYYDKSFVGMRAEIVVK